MVATLQSLAELVNAKIYGDASIKINSVATLANASSSDIAFLASAAHKDSLTTTKAAAVLLEEKYRDSCPVTATALVVDNPLAAYAKVSNHLFPQHSNYTGIDSSAIIDNTVKLPDTVTIGPNAVIGPESVIAENVFIGPGVVLGSNVKLGIGTWLHANVTIADGCEIGNNCIIHQGAVIGSDGFGNAHENDKWIKIPQLGRVIIGNDVEVGANTTIDRGALDDTIVHNGVRLDNLIHIAHNVEIGENTAIAACTGIAGSTKIGKNCMIAGQVGISGHLTIADNVTLTGRTTVLQSIIEPGVYSSCAPLDTNRNWHKTYIRTKQLDDMAKQIKKLEKEIESLK